MIDYFSGGTRAPWSISVLPDLYNIISIYEPLQIHLDIPFFHIQRSWWYRYCMYFPWCSLSAYFSTICLCYTKS